MKRIRKKAVPVVYTKDHEPAVPVSLGIGITSALALELFVQHWFPMTKNTKTRRQKRKGKSSQKTRGHRLYQKQQVTIVDVHVLVPFLSFINKQQQEDCKFIGMTATPPSTAAISSAVNGHPPAMNARGLAQELVAWYLDQIDPLKPHASNVESYFRGPVTVLTADVLHKSSATNGSKATATTASAVEDGHSPEDHPLNAPETPKDWHKYLVTETASKDRESLSERSISRLDAFLEGVALAVISENPAAPPEKPGPSKRIYSTASSSDSFGLVEGLVGFKNITIGSRSILPHREPINRQNSATSGKIARCPQISETELVTRLELYIRCLHRVLAQHHDCVVALEPAKALRARTRSLVRAFVATVGTVQHVSPVLSRLLTVLTKELLAVSTLSENLTRVIRRIVSDYVHTTSFASLAFLSSPEAAADQRLTPVILKYLLYLQKNWQHCERECDVERFLTVALDPEMRYTFKHAEFQSIGHLLEVCSAFRQELQNIQLMVPPKKPMTPSQEEELLNQAVLDLQREVITVNGSILPTVTNRTDLIELLANALNTRSVLTGVRSGKKTSTSRRKSRKTPPPPPSIKTREHSESESDGAVGVSGSTSSGADAGYQSGSSGVNEFSTPNAKGSISENSNTATPTPRRRSTFRLSTVDFLTKRLLLAASRTGIAGDAYFVVRDLFGGDGVEVVASKQYPFTVRPATIDLLVRLASVTIKCHASFDVYPKSLVGETEPLIQIHTTTTETILLQEVRAPDQQQHASASINNNHTADSPLSGPVMVLQERQTENSGKRILSVKPALYEKVEVWNTPS